MLPGFGSSRGGRPNDVPRLRASLASSALRLGRPTSCEGCLAVAPGAKADPPYCCTCALPGPWHRSHDVPKSVHFVSYLRVAPSNVFVWPLTWQPTQLLLHCATRRRSSSSGRMTSAL